MSSAVRQCCLGLGVAVNVEPAADFEMSASTRWPFRMRAVVFPTSIAKAAANVCGVIERVDGTRVECRLRWVPTQMGLGAIIGRYHPFGGDVLNPGDRLVVTGFNAADKSMTFRAAAMGTAVVDEAEHTAAATVGKKAVRR